MNKLKKIKDAPKTQTLFLLAISFVLLVVASWRVDSMPRPLEIPGHCYALAASGEEYDPTVVASKQKLQDDCLTSTNYINDDFILSRLPRQIGKTYYMADDKPVAKHYLVQTSTTRTFEIALMTAWAIFLVSLVSLRQPQLRFVSAITAVISLLIVFFSFI